MYTNKRAPKQKGTRKKFAFQNLPCPMIQKIFAFISGLLILSIVFLFVPEAHGGEEFFHRGSFFLRLPEGWENTRVPAFDYDFTLSAVVLKTSGDGTQFRPQVGITTEYTHHPSAESYYQRVVRDTTAISAVTKEEEGTIILDGIDGFWFTYLWETVEGTARVRAYLLHTPFVSYRLLCLASENTFFNHLPDFKSIVTSFRRGEGK